MDGWMGSQLLYLENGWLGHKREGPLSAEIEQTMGPLLERQYRLSYNTFHVCQCSVVQKGSLYHSVHREIK